MTERVLTVGELRAALDASELPDDAPVVLADPTEWKCQQARSAGPTVVIAERCHEKRLGDEGYCGHLTGPLPGASLTLARSPYEEAVEVFCLSTWSGQWTAHHAHNTYPATEADLVART